MECLADGLNMVCCRLRRWAKYCPQSRLEQLAQLSTCLRWNQNYFCFSLLLNIHFGNQIKAYDMMYHGFALVHLPWSCRPLERCSLPLSNASDSSLFDPSQCFEKEKVLIQRCIFCWLKGYFCGNTKATGRVTSPLNIWWIVDARCGVVQMIAHNEEKRNT